MPMQILMPKLGLTMTEGKIVEWRKDEKDPVKTGEILFVLETEKVVHEVESPAVGILGRILTPVGETAPVGTVVAYLLKNGETMDALPAESPPTAEQASSGEETKTIRAESPRADKATGARIRVTPLAKKMARELKINLSSLTGTGPSGRIIADDVRKASSFTASPQAADVPGGQIIPLTGMRQAIAKNMMTAKVETAQTYMSLSANASGIVNYRQTLIPFVTEKFGVKLTITDLMMKITSAAIMEHKVINTRWTDQGILFLPAVHMGMAMALDDGLIVPVIRDINNKSLGQIAQERTSLIKKIKNSQYLPDDIKGSTFTLSTLGMYGIEWFTANINHPESAILAVGAVTEKPVVIDGQIAIKPMMNITLTYDHRIIDGAMAAQFMQTLKICIENPIRLLV